MLGRGGEVERIVELDRLEPRGGERVVVIGGANTDLVGVPGGPLIERDSNPGTVTATAGGVGRNIAENLARLGIETHLISAFGNDESSRELLDRTRAAGVRTESSYVADDVPGARYIAINDAGHDLAVAVSDMRVLERLTPDQLAHPARRRLLDTASLVVIDANLREDTLSWIAQHVRAPLVADPVSLAKAPRLNALLPRLAAMKPNGQEAAGFLGREAVEGLDNAEDAARALVARGVGRVFVTPGPAGVVWADRGGSGQLASPGIEPVNTNGAGDAFVAGVVYAMLSGTDTAGQALFASALSILALASEDTVNPEITRESALATLKELYG